MANAPLPTLAPEAFRPAVARAHPARWSYVLLAGRLVELSGHHHAATLTLAARLILEAQHEREPVAWITHRDSIFFPPDLSASGVDVASLVVVRVPDTTGVAKAADLLVRSDGFGLLILDLGTQANLPFRLQARLASLARHHHTLFVLITEKAERSPSLGSSIALHAHTHRKRVRANEYACLLTVTKDKRQGPGWTHTEIHSGPLGLH